MPRFRLFYHFVWATELRLPLVTDQNREVIYGAISAKTKALGGITHAVNGMPDHVHVVATVPPSVSLSRFVGEIKGASSHLATHRETSRSDQSLKWQDSYGVTSISEADVPIVVRYVRNQQQHHAAGGTTDAKPEETE